MASDEHQQRPSGVPPRRPKGRRPTLPHFDILDAHLLAAIRDAKGRTPHGAKLAGAVVKMLIERIRLRDRKTAKYVEGVLQTLVGVETFLKQHPSVERQKKELEIYQEYLLRIAASPIPRRGHMENALYTQRQLLIRFFQDHPAPLDPVSPEDTQRWVEENWQQVIDFIGWLPCLCNCSTTLDIQAFNRIPLAEGTLGLVRALLAYLHNTTPEQVNKLLKQSEKVLFRDRSGQE